MKQAHEPELRKKVIVHFPCFGCNHFRSQHRTTHHAPRTPGVASPPYSLDGLDSQPTRWIHATIRIPIFLPLPFRKFREEEGIRDLDLKGLRQDSVSNRRGSFSSEPRTSPYCHRCVSNNHVLCTVHYTSYTVHTPYIHTTFAAGHSSSFRPSCAFDTTRHDTTPSAVIS